MGAHLRQDGTTNASLKMHDGAVLTQHPDL